MRPRKKILLYCANEKDRSVLAFLLDNKGYRVLGGISESAPIPAVALVIEDCSLATAAMATEIANRLPAVPLLVHMAPGRKVLPPGYPGNSQPVWRPVKPDGSEHFILLERLRLLARRKPGNKKGWQQTQPQLQTVTA